MTRNDDFIGQLESYLDEYEGMTPLPNAVRNAVRAHLPETRQLGRFSGPMRRFPAMSNTVRIALAAAAAAVVVVALLGYQALTRPDVGDPGPSLAPSLAPSPSVTVRDFTGYPGGGTELDPGVYRISYASPVQVMITIPAEPFEGHPSKWYKALFDWGPWHQSNAAQLGFAQVNNTFNYLFPDNPCIAPVGVRNPPVGLTVDDLAQAIAALPGVEVVGPSDVSLAGVSGKLMELTGLERPADCPEDLGMWQTTRGQTIGLPGAGDSVRVWILDVAGTRLVVWAAEGAAFTDQAAMQSLIDSIQIE